MALGQLGHHGNRRPRVGESDGVGQQQQATNRGRLVLVIETKKWTREMPPGSADRGTAGAVVPVRRGVALTLDLDPDQELLDQETIVEDDPGDGGHLLIGQVWVPDTGESGFVAVPKRAAKFEACGLYATRDDECGISEIDNPYFTALFEAPTVAKLSRQICLATMRHLGR